jgi:hypothetical protein
MGPEAKETPHAASNTPASNCVRQPGVQRDAATKIGAQRFVRGRDFRRADRPRKRNGALAPEGNLSVKSNAIGCLSNFHPRSEPIIQNGYPAILNLSGNMRSLI